MAFRIIHDMEKAEDVVMDVFEKAWNERERLDSNGNVRAYVYTMVKNRSLEMLRNEARIVRLTGEFSGLNTPEGEELMEEGEIEKLLLLDQIYVSIRQLPPKCAQVFTMAKINGLPYAQIAKEMNVSVKTVENQMGKALRLLRGILANKFKNQDQ
jgi:RNA polymerase sigma-70 factor (ECF subfamily)